MNTNGHGDAGDDSDKLLAAVADAHIPLGDVSRDKKSPAKEFHGVVKAEHVIIVLNVIVFEQFEHLLELFFVGDIHSHPLITSRKRNRLLWHILRLQILMDWIVERFADVFARHHNRLFVPEIMVLVFFVAVLTAATAMMMRVLLSFFSVIANNRATDDLRRNHKGLQLLCEFFVHILLRFGFTFYLCSKGSSFFLSFTIQFFFGWSSSGSFFLLLLLFLLIHWIFLSKQFGW